MLTSLRPAPTARRFAVDFNLDLEFFGLYLLLYPGMDGALEVCEKIILWVFLAYIYLLLAFYLGNSSACSYLDYEPTLVSPFL